MATRQCRGTGSPSAPRVISMTSSDVTPPAPPAGPFFSTWGPPDGPILRRDQPPAIGVVATPGNAWPIGIAYPVGTVAHRKGPAVSFRLGVHKVELDGRWICESRRFVLLGDAAEEL